MRRELVCIEPSGFSQFTVRSVDLPYPGTGEVLVRVLATTVNPIDVKRAAGYGRRLLRLKGAARFPLVLGNDVAGIVECIGTGVTGFTVGQRVFGLLATSRVGGAHASHVIVPHHQLRPAPADADPAALAVLPYSFTTMCLALRSIGVTAESARDANVLISGASGGLGRLALQLLDHWGARVTAICARGERQASLAAGAKMAVEYGPGIIESLPSDFDAVMNFASWDDEPMLASRLGARAFGLATTVHPLLANVDQRGYLRGAWASGRDHRRVRKVIASRAPNAKYTWTLFRPDGDALDALAEGVWAGRIALPIGTVVPFSRANAAFEHVASGRRGRAVLLP